MWALSSRRRLTSVCRRCMDTNRMGLDRLTLIWRHGPPEAIGADNIAPVALPLDPARQSRFRSTTEMLRRAHGSSEEGRLSTGGGHPRLRIKLEQALAQTLHVVLGSGDSLVETLRRARSGPFPASPGRPPARGSHPAARRRAGRPCRASRGNWPGRGVQPDHRGSQALDFRTGECGIALDLRRFSWTLGSMPRRACI